jgi:hypothetical protein
MLYDVGLGQEAELPGGVAEYPWSSHAANSQGRLDPMIGPHPAYVSLAEKIEHRLRRGRPDRKMGSVPVFEV